VELVDQFIAARNITHQQYQTLSEMVLADGNVDEHERQQVKVSSGKAGGFSIWEPLKAD
jgi:hypothetical protein